MKFTSVLLVLSVATQSVFAHPYHAEHTEESKESILESRQSGFTVVSGAPGSAVYPRLEVRQMLFTKPNQWILFMLGMQRFHATNQADKMSYYQIAGIHGVPRQNWDNVGQCSSCGGTDGYCTHDSVLFPSWHRAYLALFEQSFLNVVSQVVAQYPQSKQAEMQGAFSTMRFPYWDWAAQPKPGYPNLPQIVSNKYVTVNDVNGNSITIINPLFRHDFTDTSQLVYSPFVNWAVTLRYPNSNANTASSTQQSSIDAFNNIRASLQDQVYQLFSTCTDYLHFSNDDAGSSSTSCSNSLEAIHNTIHTTAGGPGSSTVSAGHMTYLATAAFDPLFWLHHTNVDRLFAMWQAINIFAYGANQVAPHSTWTIPAGQLQTADSPLTPFHKDTSGNFWTTNDVRDMKVFKYTYPEFANSDGSINAIKSYVNKLYGPGATATAGSSKRTAAPEAAPYAAGNTTATAGTAYPTATGTLVQPDNATPLRANNGSLYQYVANIRTPRYALNGSYSVFVFNRAPTSEDPTTWSLDANLIGPYGILAQPGMTEKNITTAGSIPLTRALTYEVTRGGLTDLSEKTVVPYLTANLKWRVAGPAGENYDPTTIPGFNISVFASSAPSPSSPDVLPKWSKFIYLADATKGNQAPPSKLRKLRRYLHVIA
nr:hypothetical protein B0A51_06674 [Rachicladosporium sp. CCFEE 5018]